LNKRAATVVCSSPPLISEREALVKAQRFAAPASAISTRKRNSPTPVLHQGPRLAAEDLNAGSKAHQEDVQDKDEDV
jgi:hypothetical protein